MKRIVIAILVLLTLLTAGLSLIACEENKNDINRIQLAKDTDILVNLDKGEDALTSLDKSVQKYGNSQQYNIFIIGSKDKLSGFTLTTDKEYIFNAYLFELNDTDDTVLGHFTDVISYDYRGFTNLPAPLPDTDIHISQLSSKKASTASVDKTRINILDTLVLASSTLTDKNSGSLSVFFLDDMPVYWMGCFVSQDDLCSIITLESLSLIVDTETYMSGFSIGNSIEKHLSNSYYSYGGVMYVPIDDNKGLAYKMYPYDIKVASVAFRNSKELREMEEFTISYDEKNCSDKYRKSMLIYYAPPTSSIKESAFVEITDIRFLIKGKEYYSNMSLDINGEADGKYFTANEYVSRITNNA